MCKKTLTMLMSGVLLFVCSCIDYNYDLANKEIATDVKLEGNSIALPVGNLKPIQLDSLIDVEEIEILDKNPDGVYSISMQDDIDDVEVDIDPITLAVDPVNYSMTVDFVNAEITKVQIKGVPMEPVTFNAPTIDLKNLNDKLPRMKSNAGKGVTNETLDFLFDQFEELVKLDPDFQRTVRINETVEIDTFVKCNFSYRLPYEVETIENIRLSSADGDTKGTKVQVVVSNPAALGNVGKKIDFNIEFPEIFRLAKDPESLDAIQVSDDKRRISLSDYELKGDEVNFSFYITELTGVDGKISDGVINIDENINYAITYKAEGDVLITAQTKREDLGFNIDLDVPLAFSDVSGKIRDIKVDFKPVEMDFKGEFDNLKYIDKINYIQFDKANSKIHFVTSMDIDWLSGFNLKEGYALKLEFPDELTIDDEISQYKGKGKEVVYKEHAFYIYDLKILADDEWSLALDRLTLNKDVDDAGKFEIDVVASVYFVDENKNKINNLVFEGCELESMVAVLDKLKGEKNANFEMLTSNLVIEDASVETEVIHSKLDAHTDFSLNEKVPNELGRIETIDFVEPVNITFDLSVVGLEDLDTDIDLDLHVALPSFLNIETVQNSNARINANVEGDTLFVNAKHRPSSGNKLTLEVLCTKLDFMGEEFGPNGLQPTVSEDGDKYINYSSEVVVVGDASIDGMEFHSQVLDKLGSIKFDVDVKLDEIQVKGFHGELCADIDNIEESFEFDLGEGLEFLKDDNNTLVLADPQIELSLMNSIGVPLDVDIEIVGKDDNNNVIETSVISTSLSILAAEYKDGVLTPKETKLLLVSDNSSKVGYQTVNIENLKNLLKKIPSSIDLKVMPKINTDVTHHIDISQPLVFSGSYAISVPLKFDDLKFSYNETIGDLQGSLGEVMGMFTNVGVKAKLDILNTIPLGLSLTVVPLDADGKVINDITIAPIKIDAGLGGDVLKQTEENEGAQKAQKIEFEISSASGDLSTLDQLSLSIEAASNHTTGSVGIKGEQGIKVSNIVLEVFGDIEIDLSDPSFMGEAE